MYFQPLNMTDCLMKTKSPLKMKNFERKQGLFQEQQASKNNQDSADAKKTGSLSGSKIMSNMRRFLGKKKSTLQMCSSRDCDVSTLIMGSLLVIACLFAAHKARQNTANQHKEPEYPSLQMSHSQDR